MVCCCSFAQLCPTLCDPMDCSMPGFPVLHYLLESAQTHVLWVDDAIQPSHPLLPSSPPALNLSQHYTLFLWVGSCIRWPKLSAYAKIFKMYFCLFILCFVYENCYIWFCDCVSVTLITIQFSSVQSLSRVQLFATPWIAARQASLSITKSQNSLKFMSIESVMPSSHLILCHPLLLLPLIPPSISLFQWVNSSHEVAKVLEFQL